MLGSPSGDRTGKPIRSDTAIDDTIPIPPPSRQAAEPLPPLPYAGRGHSLPAPDAGEIASFRELYRDLTGLELTTRAAGEIATNLVQLFYVCHFGTHPLCTPPAVAPRPARRAQPSAPP